MVTGVHEEITYWYPSTISGEQKKKCSISQPHFRSENTSVTNEADHFSGSSAIGKEQQFWKFPRQYNRISKMPKSLTTTMPTFTWKSEKFELFEYLFQTSRKIHNQLTGEKMTETTTSTLSRGEMRYKHIKTLTAQPERIWEKTWQFFEGST